MIIRRATADDARACARIVSRWIEASTWMPGGPSEDALTEMMCKGFPIREAWVAIDEDQTIRGYLSMKADDAHIMGLYVDTPGAGIGKRLVDHVKDGRDYLRLRSHMPNRAAHRFYEREGFAMVQSDLEGDDGVGELLMEWHR